MTRNETRRRYVMQIFEVFKLMKFNEFTYNDVKGVMTAQTFSRLSRWGIVTKQHSNFYKFTDYSLYFMEHNLPYTSQYNELLTILGDTK